MTFRSDREAERRLVARCLAGEAGAWTRLWQGVLPGLRRVLAAYRFRPDETEDCCQDLFVRVWEDRERILGSFEGRAPLGSYLAVILVRQALRTRARAPLPAPLGDTEDPRPGSDAASRDAERSRTLEKALAALSGRERLLVRMVHLDGRPVGEAARLLKLSLGNAYVLLHRARGSLRRALPEDFV